MNKKFYNYRKEYPIFIYDGFKLKKRDGFIKIKFDFVIDGLCEFHPEIKIITDNLNIINDFDSQEARAIIFALGLTEAISYWKCACPPRFIVRCGILSDEEKLWWKKLWYNGLGEFFYINRIKTDFDSFVNIENEFDCEISSLPNKKADDEILYNSSGLNIIPIGGGKDSVVTLELLDECRDKNMCFTVNDQLARNESVIAAGYSDKDIIKTFRVIDRELLQRNTEGFLNGHTPFSAIVAFLSYYCAYITGAENVILSNEASANEASVDGTNVNHQYSKSYEFESDFNEYVNKHFGEKIKYFSLLRAFNELQIAKQFAKYEQYHSVFKSCNAGSKKNIWCCNCAKCLFVYIILSPFLVKEEMKSIFGCDMLAKDGLKEEFDGLLGILNEKPFECIGTVEEVRCALELTAKRYSLNSAEKLPPLLDYYLSLSNEGYNKSPSELLGEFNKQNNIPQKFNKYVMEMYKYVSKAD